MCDNDGLAGLKVRQIPIIPLSIGNFFFLSFTNSSLFMLLSTGIVFFFFYLVTFNGGTLVPNRWQSIGEILYEFVFGSLDEQITYRMVLVEMSTFLFCARLFLMLLNE